MKDKFPGTREDARQLLEAIFDPEFLSVACPVCNKPVRDHTSAEVKDCGSKPISSYRDIED
jgi:hypothetical protein